MGYADVGNKMMNDGWVAAQDKYMHANEKK